MHIEEWRNKEFKGKYPCDYVDGIYLKFENVSIFAAIGVNSDVYRKVIGAVECLKEDKDSRKKLLRPAESNTRSGKQ